MKPHPRRGAGLGLGIVLMLLTGCKHRSSESLSQLALRYGTDKQISQNDYTDLYEPLFSPLRESATRILEIGILKGASLKMWRDYFPRSVVYGIDIVDSSFLDSARIKTFVADQGDRKALARFIGRYGGDFDLIVDDASHQMDLQQISFGYLFPYLRSGGYYVIEDLYTSLDPSFGAEADGRNTTLTMVHSFINNHRLASRYMTKKEQAYVTTHTESCVLWTSTRRGSICCVFKKK